MFALLHEEALDNGSIKPYGANPEKFLGFEPAYQFFANYAKPPGFEADVALLRRVAAKAQLAVNF